MTVIRMTIFITPQSPSVVMKPSRDFGFAVLFPNDLYVSQNEPFKLHCLCAIPHTCELTAVCGKYIAPAWPRWSKGQRFFVISVWMGG